MTTKRRHRIRKDDTVMVITGNSRGKTGKVFRVDGDKIYIQGVNERKKHVKPTRTSKGGIITKEGPVHVSNVGVSIDGKARAKLRVSQKDGKKNLYYKDGSKEVVYRTVGRK